MTMYHDFPHTRARHILNEDNIILLETSKYDSDNCTSYLFNAPLAVLSIDTPSELPSLIEQIEDQRHRGHWAVGYLAYECGYHFEAIAPLRPVDPPLAWFGIYKAPILFDHRTGEVTPPALFNTLRQEDPPSFRVTNVALDSGPEEYEQNIHRILRHLHEGDTYQVNFTTAFRFCLEGDPLLLYLHLRQTQRVHYGAFIRNSGRVILSLSPELFFTVRDGQITTRPMKGTIGRGRTLAEDRQHRDWLATDEKCRAENVMIVDLLRNDLGRICIPGSVGVRNLFTVETYETLHQMTSTIRGTLRQDVTTFELLRSLFPCGSVTGAPKIRSMQIIHDLEAGPRGVYTGAIGFFAPDGSATFNVAIRTIVIEQNRCILGVGGGIVAGSRPEQEYRECLVKARFLTEEHPHFELFETLLWNDGYPLLEQHLDRLMDSAAYFDFSLDRDTMRRYLTATARAFRKGVRMRVRLRASRTGAANVTSEPLPVVDTSHATVALYPVRTDSRNRFLFHKTTNRPLYTNAYHAAQESGLFDVLFENERGELTEGAITNLFVKKNGLLLTPPVEAGLLNGVYRQHVLATHPETREYVLTLDDLRTAEAVYLCNAVRGMVKVRLADNLLLHCPGDSNMVKKR